MTLEKTAAMHAEKIMTAKWVLVRARTLFHIHADGYGYFGLTIKDPGFARELVRAHNKRIKD